jgi:5-(carboxyamino)imidazole ribonucleotide synthase|tara:strand:- start:4778 stop:5941 length:1164 start_codon:yes stop_codon:yes gene_type:complete
MSNKKFFSSNFKLGILGGGQLGKMLLQDCIRYDIYTKVMDPNKEAPCQRICNDFTIGNLTNYEDVVSFCEDVDIVTVEIENVNVDALEFLEKNGKKVFPSSKTLRIIQDKSKQKDFYTEHDLPTSSYKNYDNLSDVITDFNQGKITLPKVWKSAKFGYDGKGVKIIHSSDDLQNLPDVPCLIEEKVKIKKEVSVIVARNQNKEEICFPAVEMEFNDHSNLVEYIICPANITKKLEEKAFDIAIKTAKSFNSIGLLAVELFITENNEILINEVAPRPHNSGHHTIECCLTSQFDQHIRAILNLPLGNSSLKSPGIMVNLIGENEFEGNVVYENIEKILKISGVSTHFYGKKKSRLNRKMGHVTIVHNDINEAKKIGKEVKKLIKVTTE